MNLTISFLGGVGTVTGSKYLIEAGGRRVLIDCGLFQGFKQLRLRNWAKLPVEPKSIDAVILTHAHIDHSGYLPLLVKNGFVGPIFCTDATRALCDILLPDSGYLQEKDAEFANRHGFSKHKPALPLYTLEDAKASLKHFKPIDFGRRVDIISGIAARFLRAGHILGAAIVEMTIGEATVVFSGDLGRYHSETMYDPEAIAHADYLVVESTYGDRRHDTADPGQKMAEVINRTVSRGGTVIIPAFAVGRAQALLYLLHQLKEKRAIGDIPIFLDSPMAIDASDTFCAFSADHKLSAADCRSSCGIAHYVRDPEESKALDRNVVPKVIMSASGMATGGRVLHHLKYFAPDPRNTILFAGFQAGGTRGAAMTGGADTVKIHGQYVPIRAEVLNLQMLSAHADADEVLAWLRNFQKPPRRTFITHGEPSASDTLRRRIEEELKWECEIPEYLERAELI